MCQSKNYVSVCIIAKKSNPLDRKESLERLWLKNETVGGSFGRRECESVCASVCVVE